MSNHGEWFASTTEYILDRRCPTCKADPGVNCTSAKRGWVVGQDFHARRVDPALAHYRRDRNRAPWPEERVPGTNYSTLKNGSAHGR